jgi:hypothetical protein
MLLHGSPSLTDQSVKTLFIWNGASVENPLHGSQQGEQLLPNITISALCGD